MISNRRRAVVLLSGGMDSCVCAALAARDYEAAALHVMYGQRTEERERRAFESVCERLGITRRMVIRNEALRQIGGSALTDATIAVPEAVREFEGRDAEAAHAGARVPHRSETGATQTVSLSDIPVTYVPFRNAHFLAAAVSWAEVLGADRVLIGAVEQDSSGYPDCRPEYYRAFNQVIRAGTKEGKIEIVTPLIGMRKSEIVTLGLELAAPFDLTWSCYSREDRACGMCESCVLRLRAFESAGVRDPIAYEAMAQRTRS
ncbi:MAG: 7-cyano-7-deazaguanine synthase QueC [Terriglobales bacterium]